MSEPVIRVLTWNILAALWAGPRHYPPQMDTEVLDRQRRLALTCDVLQYRATELDVVALQEVTFRDLDVLHDALGRDDFVVGTAQYPEHYWAHWLEDPSDWEPNGTALFIRNSALRDIRFGCAPVGEYGNQIVFATARSITGAYVTVASVHLDADDEDRRMQEWDALLQVVDTGPRQCLMICGDLNADTSIDGFARPMALRGVTDALSVMGNHDPTHPYARPGDGHARWARIDHVLTRGLTPISGGVADAGVWNVAAPEARMEALLRRTGSDHHAVDCTFGWL